MNDTILDVSQIAWVTISIKTDHSYHSRFCEDRIRDYAFDLTFIFHQVVKWLEPTDSLKKIK